MRYQKLGASGLEVSVLSLGSWLTYGKSVEDDIARECVDHALEAGVNVIDTADIYNFGAAERVLGEVLASRDRERLVVATKAFFPMSQDPNDRGLSRKHLTESLDKSLARLRTEYVDLYQCHRLDEATPIREVVATMGDFVRRGKILYWGVSFWPSWAIVAACHLADDLGVSRPISNQPPYSLLSRGIEREVVPASIQYGVGQIVFSPLAQGVLTGKYAKGDIPADSRAGREDESFFMEGLLSDENIDRVERLRKVAKAAGVGLAELSLAWVLHQPGIDSAIFGASRPEHVEQNLRAVDVTIEPDLAAAIETATA